MPLARPWLLLVYAPLLTAQAQAPFSFADPTVRIPVAAQDGPSEIVLRSAVNQPKAPEINDITPSPPAAAVKFDPIHETVGAPNAWRYKVTVRGLLPASTAQQHYARVGDQTLTYVVTNQPTGSFAWSIAKPADPWVAVTGGWFDDAGACMSFSVTPKDSPATGVTLAASMLVEQNTKKAIPIADLILCRAGASCDRAQPSQTKPNSATPLDLPASQPTILQVCTTGAHAGNYHGSVVLASLQKPDGDTILQNASFSSIFIRTLGFILILLGVFVAWLVKVFMRGRLDRDQALMPAVLMRSQVLRMQQTLAGLRAPYRPTPVNLNAAITTLLNELSTPVLQQGNLLPPLIPNPFGPGFDPAALKAYLEARNSRVQLLSILIDEGVRRAEAEDNGAIAPAPVAQVNGAITQIDNIWLAAPRPAADIALQQVRGIVAALHAAIIGAPLPAAAPGPVPAVRGDFDILQLEMQKISIAIWLIYGLLTALSGFAVLVLNNAGFGIPMDMIFAFFWDLDFLQPFKASRRHRVRRR